MPTQTKENYLKALYHLHQKDPAISVTDLGKELNVSKPTANDMVKKLQAKGWVHYEKYKPLHLTQDGQQAAAIIIRRHRLAEMFLTQVMGFGWEEVHEIAEQLEHIKSTAYFDRMDELLGFPTVDPHGSPIPDKEGNITPRDYQPLSKIPTDSKVILRALHNSGTDFLLYLNKKEISLGTQITVLQVEDFDQSYTVQYDGHENVVLSQAICDRLLVELL